jgi:hypothetical protein
MVKRRRHRSDEIMLIPFLDILCSLIGVLVLIIVVLVVAQTQRVTGRTREEIQRAEDHLKLLRQKAANTVKFAGLDQKLEQLKQAQSEADSKKQLAEKMQEDLVRKQNDMQKKQASAVEVKMEIENLRVEIRGFTGQEPELHKKVEDLIAELEKLKPPPNNDPTVKVVPTGSGTGIAPGSIFFIDTAADKLKFYWNEKDFSVVSSVPEVLTKDDAFNSFLDAVKRVPNSRIVFITRSDGVRSYQNGAGWAQQQHNYPVEKVGRMPVPGQGQLDVSLFGKLLGSIPMPDHLKKAP